MNLVNGSQALYVKQGCLTSIPGNLLLTKTCMLFYSFYTIKTYFRPNSGILLKRFDPKQVINWLAFCFLVNLDFSLLHTTYFLRILLFYYLFVTWGFWLSVFFGTSNNTITLFYIQFKHFNISLSSSLSIVSNFLKPQQKQLEKRLIFATISDLILILLFLSLLFNF